MYGLPQPSCLGWRSTKTRKESIHALFNNSRGRLTALEGIGPIGAMSLYATLDSGHAFSKGSEASAYIGLTPRQYSSGGKVNIVGLSTKVGNRKLRSVLIQGALAYVYRMKEPRSCKDRWLKDLIERAGQRRAAVALANKYVRTAWALIARARR